jgi:hypothetical protein
MVEYDPLHDSSTVMESKLSFPSTESTLRNRKSGREGEQEPKEARTSLDGDAKEDDDVLWGKTPDGKSTYLSVYQLGWHVHKARGMTAS